GKELFNRWAGAISAGLIALLPGEFLGRSVLGFTDHHVAETLFTTVTVLFLILAIKSARERELTFSHFNRRDLAKSLKPIIYSLLGGIFLGIYFLTWAGALLFIFIIAIYFIIQFIIDHLKRRSTDYLCIVGIILILVALLVFLPVSPSRLYLAAMVIAILIPLALGGVSWLMASRQIKVAYYPLTLAVLGLVGITIFYLVYPSLLSTMLGQFGTFFAPKGAQLTTIEMQPLLRPQGIWMIDVAWGNFTTGFFLSFISLGIVIYQVVKQGSAEKSLLVVWCLVMLAATLGQRRFAYYFAVNVALLTGYLSWKILELAGFKRLMAKPLKILKKLDYYKVLGVPRNATDKQIKRAFRELTFKYRAASLDGAEERIEEINEAHEVLSDPHKRADYNRYGHSMAESERRKTRRKGG
ncbi:STT3 domain-containing protein, partial [Candidatus Omnitrophota bacterium]